MISSEKAWDMLPYVSDIYEKLDITKYIESNQIQLNPDDDFKTMMLSVGLGMFSYILKSTPKIKTEVFTIVSILEDKTMEEVLAQSPTKTIKAFRSIFEDKELLGFFKDAAL